MIDRIGYGVNLGSVSNAAVTKSADRYLGFEETLVEKAVSQRTMMHGFVGDGQDLCPGLNEATIEMLKSLMSLSNDLENIWEIVLRLEEKVDIKALTESTVTELDEAAGLNSVAALLTQFWKKKELSGDTVSESVVEISAYSNQDRIENKAASDLEALMRKNKQRKLITTVDPDQYL